MSAEVTPVSLADADLTLEFEGVAGGLRRSFTVTGNLSPRLCVVPVRVWPLTVRLTTKRSCDRSLLGRIADVEHRRGDVLPGRAEDDGVAVHQSVNGREIPDFIMPGAALGEGFIWRRRDPMKPSGRSGEAEARACKIEIRIGGVVSPSIPAESKPGWAFTSKPRHSSPKKKAARRRPSSIGNAG